MRKERNQCLFALKNSYKLLMLVVRCVFLVYTRKACKLYIQKKLLVLNVSNGI